MAAPSQAGHQAVEIISGYSKLAIDWMKHLMTLSVGIIVVVGAFREHVLKGALMIWTLPLAIVCLLLCVLFAMRVSFDLVYHEALMATVRAWSIIGSATPEQVQSFKKDQEKFEAKDRQLKRYLRLTNIAFASGVVCITMFVIRNFALMIVV